MSMRPGQLQLVFSQSIRQSSMPLKMSLSSSAKRSPRRRDSLFIEKMRRLERLSPDYARVVEGIADGVFKHVLGAPIEW